MKLSRMALPILAAAALAALAPVAHAQSLAASLHPRTERTLALTIPALDVHAEQLSRVIDYLQRVSGGNLVVDWAALDQAGVTRDTPITMTVSSLPLRKVLSLVLDQASPNTQLTYYVSENVLTITTQAKADHQLVTRVYPVADLVMPKNGNVNINASVNTYNQNMMDRGAYGGGFGTNLGFQGASASSVTTGNATGYSFNTNPQPQQANPFLTQPPPNNNPAGNPGGNTMAQNGQALVDLITSTIRPDIWRTNGGPASITYFNGNLVVSAPVSVQELIGGPLEK